MTIQPLTADQYTDIARIYLSGIATGRATFQTDAPTWEAWDQGHLRHSRLGAFVADALVGWVALSPVSSRCVYEGVAEVSIYIDATHRGQGVGVRLLRALIIESERHGIWTLQSSIFEDNTASINLHETCGFRRVGVRERIGQLHGIWKNNVLMERRSTLIGI